MEKKPLESKKFIAFVFSMLLLTGTLVLSIVLKQTSWAMSLFMVSGIITIGALAIGYVISQAALDKFMVNIVKLKTKEETDDGEGNTTKTESETTEREA
jgi:hypothetical protein